ncbi:NADH-quinone oxidoreductase subunit A [Rubrobacter radiotolerans]|uniref:NADH-quinone oxidoreductase subunit A n=1 Tax=Rubrobacter radiotolerans TaxID=42256 RepID=A0AB35T7X4_RUBRA|nr:NADH-quinone oxidoreductase subunit A [Rubrobacter radiotolerans]MDX5894263.1 NADH-quinone oxidoreductase subunit A [Rubrobacter radiotolerans]SMC05595.1 NADH-quinone oxidoreductase subunit A [Rubrobacter radiotolerans DSM 5868]
MIGLLLQGGLGYEAAYLYVGAFMLVMVAFGATVLVVARLVSPSKRSATKEETYETGESAVNDPWRPFPVRYYVFALTFLIFDVEALFLFPWAVIYGGLGLFGFVQMLIFVVILSVGLIYEWKKGALKWV